MYADLRFSEKARIPAWTDRILRKGSNLRQLLYNSAPLKFSDHRPVHAAFECKVSIVDEQLRETISKELYQRRKADVGDATAHLGTGEDSDDEDLIGYDSIEPGLPPASSDRQKWWLDNKQPARAAVPVPKPRSGQAVGLNPNRPSNPFGLTEEPDWISIPRSSSKASLSSMSSSPFEKVSLPNSMASTSSIQPRKLPPPYDPSSLPAKVGRINLMDDQTPMGHAETPPPPPPPRRGTSGVAPNTGFGLNRVQAQSQPLPPPLRPTSAASHVSQFSQNSKGGKPAPPVAKKPAHLTTTSPSSSPGLSHSLMDEDFRPPLPSRAQTGGPMGGHQLPGLGAAARKPVGLPNQGTNGTGLKPSSSIGGTTGGVPSRRPAPPVQPKPQLPQPNQHQRQGSMDLLGSLDDSQNVGGWETLKPSTRT